MVREREPVGNRQAGWPGSGELATADKLLERECPRPHRRCRHDGIPQLLAGHGEHEVGPDQVVLADPAAAVRADIQPAGGQCAYDLGRWRLARP